MRSLKYLLAVTALLTLLASPALAYEPGEWILRAGAGSVQPESDNLTFVDAGESIVIDVDNSTAMTLSATYMFNRNWAFDLLASTPFKHDITATVQIPDSSPEMAKIADTKQLPPTVSFQYHFAPDATFQPYLGLGVNYTNFYDTRLVSEMSEVGVDKLSLDDSFGLAAQLGGDWAISDNWLFNLDVRWINIESDVTVEGPDFDGAEQIGKVKVDPWMYAVNLGYRF